MSRWHCLGLIVAFSVTLPLATSAQPPQMPKPGPHHKAMGVFAGQWSFEGQAQEGPMGPAGTITFTESCDWFEGGFALVCRTDGKGPMGPSKSLSIMSYDMQKKAYTYYGVETGMPPFMATGQLDGKVWRWEATSTMGGQTMTMRVNVTETSPTSYTFDMKASMDGGSTWMPVMEGKSTKKGS